jgi:autotransporter translocation and assembly factor TamB
MRSLRRFLQVVAIVGTLMIGVLAVALIVSQTPWFKDWLRRYIVRESKQYLNGELTIGGLSGNLFFGVSLADVAVDVSGQRVVAVKGLEVDYSVFRLISEGLVLDEIKLVEPRLRLEHDADGWNMQRLLKEQRKEAEREGPGQPVALQSFEVADGSFVIDDQVGTTGYQMPHRIDDVDIKGSFQYDPVHFTVGVDRISLRASSPDLTVREMRGKVAVRDDNLYIEGLLLRTADSSVEVDGVVEQYLRAPVLKLTSTVSISTAEIARVVPAAAGFSLNPRLNVRANGPASRLAIELDVRSEAGNVRGQLTADAEAPDFAVKAELDVERLNLERILKDPEQRSDISGHAKLDLGIASSPEDAPAQDRLKGTFGVSAQEVVAAGYQATDVTVTGSLDGARIALDGRARAYGSTATASGFIVTPAPGRPLSFDLRGRADDVDPRRLPASTQAPKVAAKVSVAEYQVRGTGGSIKGSVRLNQSELEGAVIAGGTVAEFASNNGRIAYTARGSVANLNLQRIGNAFNVAALARPEYDSQINAQFDVTGAVSKPDALKLDASGTVSDSSLMGASIPQLGFEAHLDNGALNARAEGRFEHLDPGRVAGRKDLEGNVSGSVNASVAITDISAPLTPESITADGNFTLTASKVGGLQINQAEIAGRYSSQIGDLTRVHFEGPDINVDASGRVALDRTSESNLKYHVDASDLAALARLAGQESVNGSVTLDGTVTGNAALMMVEGALDASGLKYQQNSALNLNSRYTVTVPELQFADAKVESTTGATFVKAGALEIDQLTATTTYGARTIGFTTSIKERTREVDAEGEVVLHPDHQEIHLPLLAFRTQGVEWRTAPDGEAAIRHGNDTIELDNVRLISGDQSLEVRGAFALKGDQPGGAIDIHARNVDLSQIERMLSQNQGLSGQLTADAKISGTADRPMVDGRVEISNGGFRMYKYDALTAAIDYQTNRIGLDVTLQQSPSESITVKGSVPTTLFARSERGHVDAKAGDEVDLRIQSSALNLGFVQGFTNQVTAVSGTFQADLHVTGSGEDPHVEGYVHVKDAGFGIPAGGVAYSGLNTRIDLTPDAVRIARFQIHDEHGQTLSVQGELAVHERQVGGVNISLVADNFEVIDNELGDVGIDTTLKLSGELRRPKVEGEVRLEAARLELDKILALSYDPYSTKALPEVVSAERSVEDSGSAEEATRKALADAQGEAAPGGKEQPAEESAAQEGAFAPVALDVRLRIPDNLVIRGKDLRPGGPTGAALGDTNITIGGDLRIRKEPMGQITLVGDVQTVRGTYEFQGRRFELARGGTVRLIGESEINPLLDVTATRQIPNTGVEARVHITGTAKAPQLQLSSNPPLEESDILSLIVFNKQVNELGTGERSSLAATAGGIATGFIAAPLGESIGRALDLDLFEITTSTEEGDLGAGLTLGQQIADRAFFKLRQQFGERNLSEFLLEYKLTDFLRLEASAAPETSGSGNRVGQRRVERGGLDLIFFFSY